MRIERWWWLIAFCFVSLIIHAGIGWKSKRLPMSHFRMAGLGTGPKYIEVELQPEKPEPKKPEPKKEPEKKKPELKPKELTTKDLARKLVPVRGPNKVKTVKPARIAAKP